MNSPLISVVLPVYNAELYITDTINSILNQTYTNFELIIINDGSNDNSEACILQFQDQRIKYFKNEKNLKLIQTLNLGLNLAKGKYIARIDADDIALPKRFEKQIDFLEKNSEYGIVGSFAETFGSEYKKLTFVQEDVDIRYAFLTHNPFVHSSVIIRNQILTENKLGFDLTQLHVEDYALWIKLLKFSKGKILPEILIKYRIHENQISLIHNNTQVINTEKIQKKYLLSLLPEVKEIDLVFDIFHNRKTTIPSVILFLKFMKANELVNTNALNQKLTKTLIKNAKNKIISAEKITFKELLNLFKYRNEFTLKQKLVFLTKLYR
jgi:glycosyltransferase involved in cell wall biosynthesis